MRTRLCVLGLAVAIIVTGCATSFVSSGTTTPTAAPSATPQPVVPDMKGVRTGASFSFSHATWLFGGFDQAKSAFEEIGCGLGVKNWRLMAPWDWVQDESPFVLKTGFNIDWQLATAKRCGAETITMVIGWKTPHWPEYKSPAWAKGLTEAQLKVAILNYLRMFAERYANDPRITAWQIENEPFFKYGKGGAPFADEADFLKQEIDTVRKADALKRPVILTVSGDIGDWGQVAALADQVGVSYYRISYDNGAYFDHATRNGEPSTWKKKANDLGVVVLVIELQAEPWGSVDIKSITPDEAEKSMSPTFMLDNLNFVLQAGFKDVFFWGAEWWLYEKQHGRPAMWELAQKIFAQGKEE